MSPSMTTFKANIRDSHHIVIGSFIFSLTKLRSSKISSDVEESDTADARMADADDTSSPRFKSRRGSTVSNELANRNGRETKRTRLAKDQVKAIIINRQ